MADTTIPTRVDDELYRGDTWERAMVTTIAAANVDVARFAIKTAPDGQRLLDLNSDDNAAQFDIDDNLITMTLYRVNTAAIPDGVYYYDLETTSTSSVRKTHIYGRLRIYGDAATENLSGVSYFLSDSMERWLKQQALSGAWRFTGAPTYDATYTDVIKTGAIEWLGDGGTGVYTANTINGTWHEATNETLTYINGAVSFTVTVTGPTRNATGQITTPVAVSVA